MDYILPLLVFTSVCIKDVLAEVCYEYRGSNTRAFECTDGCCGTRSDAYCCMSPAIIVGIVVGSIAVLLIIGVCIFICYQKHKQRQFNKIQRISIGNIDEKPKSNKHQNQHSYARGGMMTTHHGAYQHNGIGGNGGGFHNQSVCEDPAYPPAQVRTGAWLINTNNTAQTNSSGPPLPPINPWLQAATAPTSENSGAPTTTTTFDLPPIVDSLPAHPGAADLYAERQPIRPLPGSLPPLPPVQPK